MRSVRLVQLSSPPKREEALWSPPAWRARAAVRLWLLVLLRLKALPPVLVLGPRLRPRPRPRPKVVGVVDAAGPGEVVMLVREVLVVKVVLAWEGAAVETVKAEEEAAALRWEKGGGVIRE